ncbi:cache domain-containing sensor histidine kinase [Cohnella terricola]|uniref:histidine kinase n=1 Tax=Cohnella terricola TaxID=1289167 RepID=A0A559JT26_9BACL|nr:sensor histidine kinase [Cohnella terricola]TVY03017.1 sensor histidine kinase [Cohnella terricola]
MRRWLANSLKRKLTLLLLFAILLPLLFAGVVSYQMAASVTEEKAKQSGMNTLNQIKDKIEFVVQDVENMSIFLIGEKDIQLYLNNEREDIARYSLIIGTLTNLAFSKKYISNITIKPKNGNPELSNSTILQSGLPPLLEKIKMDYRKTPKRWTSLYENQTTEGLKRVISLVRPVRNFYNFKEMGWISVSLDQKEIERFIDAAGWEKSGYVLLLDKDGTIISGGDPSWLTQPLSAIFPDMEKLEGTNGVLKYGSGKEQKTILYNTIPSLGWELVGFIPTQVYRAQNNYVLTVTAFATGIALLLAVGLMLYFIQWVTTPLTKLTRSLKELNLDEKIPTYTIKSADEIGLLVRSYNKLGEKIDRLKTQVQLNEAKKKEADIQALQAQINPHFLYNTLSSIHWIALMNKDRQIAEMVGALSDFMRFSLNKGEEYCQVRQEISHAQNYAYIQSIRFPDQFTMEFFVDPDMMPMPMLKLLLQPLIENSLIHGIQKKKEKGQVFVHGELQGSEMKFVVEDTGIGIEEGRLREIRRQLLSAVDSEPQALDRNVPKSGSYGLLNVHRRLKLHYGNDSGLTIDSEAGKGTRISFTIPLREERP